MSLFRRRTAGRSSESPPAPTGESPFSFDPRAPEIHAERGKERYGNQDFPAAVGHFEKAIDMLHTLYLFEEMRNRQPSSADAWIVDGYTSSLGAALAMDASADVGESVRTVTHRLRTISTAAHRVGASSTLYRDALAGIARCAPHVDVNDVLWS